MSAASNKYNNHGQPAHAFEDGGMPVIGKEEQLDGGASATDAALALSRLPVLGHFRKKLSFGLAIVVIIVNLVALIGLVVYFRRLCTNQYGVLPNESGNGTPPALASLESQGGVTIISRTLVNFMNDTSYAQLGQGYWTPLALTCGRNDSNLKSCAATLPIVVEYEQCHPWVEAFALATGLLVYVGAGLTFLFALILCVVPCAKDKKHTPTTLWDFLVYFADA